MSAEYGRSCEGCGMLVAENWKGQKWFRCGADSQWKGYTVGIERLNPILPKWCPERKTDCHTRERRDVGIAPYTRNDKMERIATSSCAMVRNDRGEKEVKP